MPRTHAKFLTSTPIANGHDHLPLLNVMVSSSQRYGSATYKAPVATVLDPNGKLSITLSYGKLLSRSQKIAYTLLNKVTLT